MVNLAGEKMSKSTGHFFAVADVRTEVDPETLRLYLLSTHYRSPIDYSEERLRAGRAGLDRIRNFLIAAGHAAGEGGGELPPASDLEGVDAEAREALERGAREYEDALDDDFNTAGALGKIFELVRFGNSYLSEGETSTHHGPLLAAYRGRILDMMGSLGFRLEAEAGGVDDIPEEVQALVQKRQAARAAKDWAAADVLRDKIRAAGYLVEDRKDGPLIKPVGG
jgi:cysteinyl-tRNA synthetase